MKTTSKTLNFGLVALAGFFFANGFARADNIYVANFSSGNIVKFDSSGNMSTTFANSGLRWPQALAFDTSGYLYTGDYSANTIEEFDSSGHGTLFASSGLSSP